MSDAVLFLSGKSKSIQKKLSVEMEKSSKKMDYEKAAVLRDRIKITDSNSIFAKYKLYKS